MRVVFDYQIFSSQVYGGISRYFLELARNLTAQEEIEIEILAPFYVNRYIRTLNGNFSIVRGLNVPYIPKTDILKNILNLVVSGYLLNKQPPDIIHETFYRMSPLLEDKHTKVVVTVHDMIHERFPQYFSSRDKTALAKRSMVQRADHIICVSETTRQDLLEIMNINPIKVSVVHLGLYTKPIIMKYKNPLIAEPYILYVGWRNEYKNFIQLLKVYANNPTLHKYYKLVCFGGQQFTRYELKLMRQLGLTENRLKWLIGDDYLLMQLYHHASLFIYPSLYEGFGIPPLEAMAQGCPVVCSNRGAIPEVVGDAGDFFDPGEEGSMIEAIQRVLFDQTHAQKLRALGKKRVLAFSWSKCVKKTLNLYKIVNKN